jgi:hypothetical protein
MCTEHLLSARNLVGPRRKKKKKEEEKDKH